MRTHPPEPRIVHPLPSAPDFLGRETELEQLRSFWDDGSRGVLSLVGLWAALSVSSSTAIRRARPRRRC